MENGKLRLFVVGSSSPHPEDWSSWEVEFVIAHDVDEARRLVKERLVSITEIPLMARLRDILE